MTGTHIPVPSAGPVLPAGPEPPADGPIPAPGEACPVREVLERVGDKWSVLVVAQLKSGPARFSALLRGTEGLSQRMLTRTLRLLERDGLVAREVRPTTPPQVTYSLTDLGRSLTEPLDHLTRWAVEHRGQVTLARIAYDERRLRADG